MSTTNAETSNSISCKGEGETSNFDNVKNRRCLKKPTPISARQKINSKTTIGTRSLSKTDLQESGSSIQRSSSKNRTRSSSIGHSRLAKGSNLSSASNNSQKRILENQYLTKKNRYNVVRKEMENKHKVAVEMYDEVLQLRDKVIASGSKDPGKPEEIGLTPCSEKDKRITDSQITADFEPPIQIPECEIDDEFMENIEPNLQSIPESFSDFCNKVLSARMAIVSWVTEYDRQENDSDFELNEKIEVFRNEENDLIEKLECTRRQQFDLIENLTRKFQSLWTECQSYRDNFRNIRNAEQNLLEVEKFKNLLEIEMEKSQKLKEGKSQVEGQLAKLRSKLKEFEVQTSNSEVKINQLQNSVEQLRTQLRQKETLLEQQAKDLQKSSKSNKSAISKLESQKETLDSRLAGLSEELSNRTHAYDDKVRELDRERQLRLQVEAKLTELREYSENLEKENKEIAAKAESLAMDEVNETRLCNELEDAKSTILKQEERIDQLHREREDLVAAMKRASGQEANEEKQNKLMADLSKTTNELKVFKEENLQLKKNLKSAVSKGETIQKQLTELHSRLQNQCKESGKADWSSLIIDLQQQNSDLKCTLADFARQNKKLEAQLSQKQVELECIQHNQGKILKVREELRSHKSSNQNGERKEGRDPKQPGPSKTEDFQEIFTALEGKQMRIMQLEKMLKQMEEQQDRAQAQRTRLETRIAQLETSAKEKSHRSKTFSIL